jgi:chromosome segregation ATPase
MVSMANPDFESLRHQFTGHWQAIEQATPDERRVLVIELAKALADWEAGQTEPLARLPDLQRSGHWSALGTLVATESNRIAARLGEEKQTLRARLTGNAAAIAASEAALAALAPEVEGLDAELAATAAPIADLAAREAALRERLSTLQRLRTLEAELTQARDELTALAERLRRVEDPTDLLGVLGPMHEQIVAFYDAWRRAGGEIVEALLGAGADALLPPPAPDLLAVPERLSALDRELRAIDQVLAARIRARDDLDQTLKARV